MEDQLVGRVAELWRYPVKSMQGEGLATALVTERGLLGDRIYAIRERATGAIASAKHPRKWGALLTCCAEFVAPPEHGQPLPPVRIRLPDGSLIRSDDPEVDRAISLAIGHEVALVVDVPEAAFREADRTALDANEGQSVIRREPLALGAAAGTFFDYGTLHILTTATLNYFGACYPAGQFALKRFRPNILIATDPAVAGLAEHAWLGQQLALEPDVAVLDPCPRCVVTTLAQGELPRDPGILRVITAPPRA